MTADGPRWSEPTRDLRRFRVPTEASLTRVALVSDEVTTLDKQSNRPDFLTVRIEYEPGDWLLGSRSLRLYFQALRDFPTSVEGLAAVIARDVDAAIEPRTLCVTVTEKPRGGISIVTDAVPHRGTEDPFEAWAESH